MADRIFGFEPVARSDARILVLGSMPSVESLRQSFYYAHPRNAFWRIAAEVFGTSMPENIAEKRALLMENGVALWDVLKSCERRGSLDGAIRQPEVNDFSRLFEDCPQIERILFNGGTAARLFARYAGEYLRGRQLFQMPSTSPAHTIPYERKLAQWRQALRYEHEPL